MGAFSTPQLTVICTCATFEPGFQIVVTLSLTRGMYCPAETDRIQKMEFESVSLNYFTMSLCVCTEMYRI